VNVQVVRYADRPELDASWDDVVGSAWPAFMLHDPTVNELWGLLYDEAPDCQLYLLDRDTGEVLAHGNSIPVAWDGSLEDLPDDGIDGVLRRVASARDDVGQGADVLCAMQAVVKPSARARGLSRRIVEAMREVARGRGLGALIAPVRPTEKSRYPLTPAICGVAQGGRAAARPVAPSPRARRGGAPRDRAAVHDDHRNGRRVGGVDRDGLPRHRPLRRARCTRPSRYRPGARRGSLRGAERVDATPPDSSALDRYP
jgi:GNAT superfamily N-acetyltransferase